jgi:hypothetical protein
MIWLMRCDAFSPIMFKQSDWLRRGEDRSERCTAPAYVKFVAAVRLAQAEARASAEVTVRKMDPKWWLGRMHRDRADTPGWTDKQQLEHTGEGGGPLLIKIISYKDV